ncbi:hypothetical protein E0L93_00615 [Rubrobacter taiwanensis]|jgi:hypothetical protein|uniref:Uncharacterized protein n=1 Tax=Rubrobacter taiwanensis TaxID=185139 RepID=A0A4R1BSI0_9ACTN|nr:hypothetical protein [Rubrobacter taiwanensis]TCJ20764.1 hypothetical protein E0L93_00615 [Rubrobacter taiwanensis]
MSVAGYYTLGALVRDLGSLKALEERLEPDGPVVLVRRRDRRVVEATLPGARVAKVEGSLSRMQWIEFGSMYFAASAAIFLIGAIHPMTGIVVQALLTVGCLTGLFLYHRRPRLRQKLTAMALPDGIIDEWEARFGTSFAVALVTVPGERFEDAQEAFLEDGLEEPFAMNRRLVL